MVMRIYVIFYLQTKSRKGCKIDVLTNFRFILPDHEQVKTMQSADYRPLITTTVNDLDDPRSFKVK